MGILTTTLILIEIVIILTLLPMVKKLRESVYLLQDIADDLLTEREEWKRTINERTNIMASEIWGNVSQRLNEYVNITTCDYKNINSDDIKKIIHECIPTTFERIKKCFSISNEEFLITFFLLDILSVNEVAKICKVSPSAIKKRRSSIRAEILKAHNLSGPVLSTDLIEYAFRNS